MLRWQAQPCKPLQDAIMNELPVQRVRLLGIVVWPAVSKANHLPPQLPAHFHPIKRTQKRGATEVSTGC